MKNKVNKLKMIAVSELDSKIFHQGQKIPCVSKFSTFSFFHYYLSNELTTDIQYRIH